MIQRIQSVYFLLAGILPAFTFCTPLVRFYGVAGEVGFVLDSSALTAAGAGVAARPWGILFLTVVSIVLAFVSLFGYGNRKRQLVWSRWLAVCLLLQGATVAAYAYSYGAANGVSPMPAWGIVFPALSLAFAVLGRRGVRQDEELVRAADRIR